MQARTTAVDAIREVIAQLLKMHDPIVEISAHQPADSRAQSLLVGIGSTVAVCGAETAILRVSVGVTVLIDEYQRARLQF